MKYISLFSGIGGFEVAIRNLFPDSECIGYSEIKESAIKVYQHHFPTHKNLGDISNITDDELSNMKCDLIVAGFPCTNLSSLAVLNGDHSGLNGPKSGLFYELLRVLRIVKPKNFIIENNFSMGSTNRNIITKEIERTLNSTIHSTVLDSAQFGVQVRKRIFWTNFNIPTDNITCTQTWNDILDPVDKIECVGPKVLDYMNKIFVQSSTLGKIIFQTEYGYTFDTNDIPGKTRWDGSRASDTMDEPIYYYPIGKSRPIVPRDGGGANLVIDRRIKDKKYFFLRYLTLSERERLFNYDEKYLSNVNISRTNAYDLLGNSVVINVIKHILTYMDK